MEHKHDLSKFKIVFCDDYNALMWAYQNNLSSEAIIKTYSPKIYYSDLKNVKKMNHKIDDTKNLYLINLYKEYLDTLKKNLFQHVSRELTFFLIQKVYLFKRVIEKVSNLSIEDFDNEILFIKIKGKSGPDTELYLDDGNILNPPWESILKNFNNFTVIEYNAENILIKNQILEKKINILKRIKLAGIDSILFRIILRFIKFLPNIIFSKQILLFRENELIIETAYQMFLKGYYLDSIKHPPNFVPTNELNNKQILLKKQFIDNLTLNINKNYLKNFIDKNFIENTINLLNFHLAKCIILFEEKKYYFEKLLKKINKKTIIFSNSPFTGNGSGAALFNVSNKLNIPFIVFQHGVGPEIEKFDKADLLSHESNLSNLYFAFNSKSKIIADNQNKFSKNFVSGISSRHLRVKSKIKNRHNSIIYISTYLPKGNFSQDSSFYSDIDIIYFELELIKKVFSKLDNNLLYKTYPQTNLRYLDGDPLINQLKINNIKYYNGDIDMRYMIDDFNIFITRSATSTLTWPLLSDKPLFFINSLKKPIDDNLKPLFKESLFYFEENDKEIYSKLYNLLTLDFDEILDIYQKKSKDRNELIHKFFTGYLFNSGKRASKKIIETINYI